MIQCINITLLFIFKITYIMCILHETGTKNMQRFHLTFRKHVKKLT